MTSHLNAVFTSHFAELQEGDRLPPGGRPALRNPPRLTNTTLSYGFIQDEMRDTLICYDVKKKKNMWEESL